jgi:hypothetical protein
MEKQSALPHDFLLLPAEIYALVVFGVLLSATFLYAMRIVDRARSENRKIRQLLEPIDFFIEVVFAAATGFSGFFAAVLFDAGPAGLVMSAHLAAYVNRPIYLLIRRYGDAAMFRLGVQVSGNTGGDSIALMREQKIHALEMQMLLETRVEEKMRLRALIENLKKFEN